MTGATAGIGRAIAGGLAAEGVAVALVARRADLLEEYAAELRAAHGVKIAVIAQDLTAQDAPEMISARAFDALGEIDILINAAGGHRREDDHGSEDAWSAALLLNFTQQRRLAEQMVGGMSERGWGRIVNITGKSEPPRVSPAFAAKAATHAWAKGLSRDLGPRGITVNCIAPGRILTEQMTRNYSEEQRAEHSKEIPVGRYGRPDELASLAVYLCSSQADYLTGTVVPFDGGLRRYQF
ncbi:SDR family oxidoreductase [Microbacterium horticulturae]|uniref:SDR family oxidoreductase n=1 Tax=Microbacterium horticulturae TaxID=3028316 RepID=A0ABY8BX69_9MICO|nr:SDR family oxidoreductase [Microbacterium sp. KACC 23027]WEG08785.1 SDR family oxidoreductase [Microbacterium sp. KACC 23027]